MDALAYQMGIKLCFSRQRKPTDNAFCQSINGELRDMFLRTNWFESISNLRIQPENRREEYKTFRPHQSLVDMSSIWWLEIRSETTESRKYQHKSLTKSGCRSDDPIIRIPACAGGLNKTKIKPSKRSLVTRLLTKNLHTVTDTVLFFGNYVYAIL